MSSPTVREGAGLDATVREGEPSATLQEGSGTGPGQQSASFVRLPRDLASRFVIERELPTRGNEADLLVVAPIDGGDRVVVKLYRAGVHPKDEVQQRIAGFDPSHVVRQIDWGMSEGRSYEVIEYAAEGSLADLMRGAPEGRLDVETLRAMIEQVSAALSYLHSLDPPVVHRDVKPDNVLVRSLNPLDLVLTDFGLASVLDEGSWRASTLDRTIRYAAPEASAGQVSREMDWWSLGMMVAEAFAGRHPFAGVAEQTIGIHYMNRQPVPLDAVTDERVRLLCLGLLTHDRQHRWGNQEVARWLAGDRTLTPPVAAPVRQSTRPFKFAGGTYGEVKALAAAMVANWDAANRTVARADGLLAWLKDEAKEYEAWQWLAEITEDKAQLDPGLKVTLLLPMLDPDLPVIFEGEPLTPQRLLTLVQEAAEGKVPAGLPLLWEHLQVLSKITYQAARFIEFQNAVIVARAEAEQMHTALVGVISDLPALDSNGWEFSFHVLSNAIEPARLAREQANAQSLMDRLADVAPDLARQLIVETSPLSSGTLWVLRRSIVQLEMAINEAISSREKRSAAEQALAYQSELCKAGWVPSLQAGHLRFITSVDLSADGRILVTGSGDNTARLWDVATGKELRVLAGHTRTVNSVALSADGNLLATASDDETVRLWDVVTGRLLKTLTGHTDSVNSLALSADGRHLATASCDKTARLWDIETGHELLVLAGHSGSVTAVTFCSDGRHVVTGSVDKTARLWDVAKGKVVRSFSGHTAALSSVAVSTDGRHVATASHDNTAKLWDLASGQELRLFVGHSKAILCIGLTADGRKLITGSEDTTCRLWDISTGKELCVFSGHTVRVSSVALSENGQVFASGSGDITVRLWDLKSGQEMRLMKGRPNLISAMALSRDGSFVATGGDDNTVRLWDFATGRQIGSFNDLPSRVMSLAFSSDGRRLITHCLNAIQSWDVSTYQPLETITNAYVSSVTVSTKGSYLVTGSPNGAVRLHDTSNGRELRRFSGHKSRVTSVAVDARHVLSGSEDKTARLWDIGNGDELQCFKGHEDCVTSVALLKCGRYLVTGSHDKTLRLWDIANGKELRAFDTHTCEVASIALSANDKHLASGGHDNTARLWDIDTGKELHVYSAHTSWVLYVTLSDDDRSLSSLDFDGQIRVWGIRNGQLLRRFVPMGNNSAVVFDGDGKVLAIEGDPDAILHFVRGLEVLTLANLRSDQEQTWRVPATRPARSVVQARERQSGLSLLKGEMNSNLASADLSVEVNSNGPEIRSVPKHQFLGVSSMLASFLRNLLK